MPGDTAGEIRQARASRRAELRGACRELPIFKTLFLMLAAFVGVDLLADGLSGIGPIHMIVELAALCVALLGVGIAARQAYAAVCRADELSGDLVRSRADLDRWRAEAEGLLRRMGTALDEHFAAWGLTAAEGEIAIAILKGLSYKEIACERGTTERTVRHQALAIFRKARVNGRAEMAAFFLEALLLPARDAARRDEERAAETPAPAASSRARVHA